MNKKLLFIIGVLIIAGTGYYWYDSQSGPSGMPIGGGAVDKSGDAELQTLIAEVAPKFTQHEYTDEKTGLSVTYNLYTPENRNPSTQYPMVVFISDSSAAGKEATVSLTQGHGALEFAKAEDQAKHASFVLVPTYPEVIVDDHGSFTKTDYVEVTKRLIESVQKEYNIDTKRTYGTGQSMGAMTTLILTAQYPDLFAKELIVSGQWDLSELSGLAGQTFFYIAAAGDAKASAGQKEVYDMLTQKGEKIGSATWNANQTDEAFAPLVAELLSEGNAINFVTFELGTVLPEGAAVGTSEHMYSFDYAYKIDAVRDWLFAE